MIDESILNLSQNSLKFYCVPITGRLMKFENQFHFIDENISYKDLNNGSIHK